MYYSPSHADPPPTIARRLERLTADLKALGKQLRASIASTISSAVAEAVRDAVRSLLGCPETPGPSYGVHRDQPAHGSWLWDEPSDSLAEEEEDFVSPPRFSPPSAPPAGPSRWQSAARATLQAGLWWLGRQKTQRHLLTGTLVAAGAGLTTFCFGPSIAACASLLATATGLLLTADSAGSVTDCLTALLAR